MKTVCLDLHDFSVLRNGLDLLEEVRSHYPGFKVTLFTIPFDYELEQGPLRIRRQEFLERIKRNLDWMQLVPHGVFHIPNEFAAADKHTMKMILSELPKVFEKDGLPMEKGFCAPYWLWTEEAVAALDEEGWWGAVDRNQPDMPTTKRFYRYSHSIDEPFWEATDEVLKLHGHMTPPSTNNLADCLPNLLKLPTDTNWLFATEFLEAIDHHFDHENRRLAKR